MSSLVAKVECEFERCGGKFSGDFFARVVEMVFAELPPGAYIQIENWCFALNDRGDEVLVTGGCEQVTPATLKHMHSVRPFGSNYLGSFEGRDTVFRQRF